MTSLPGSLAQRRPGSYDDYGDPDFYGDDDAAGALAEAEEEEDEEDNNEEEEDGDSRWGVHGRRPPRQRSGGDSLRGISGLSTASSGSATSSSTMAMMAAASTANAEAAPGPPSATAAVARTVRQASPPAAIAAAAASPARAGVSFYGSPRSRSPQHRVLDQLHLYARSPPRGAGARGGGAAGAAAAGSDERAGGAATSAGTVAPGALQPTFASSSFSSPARSSSSFSPSAAAASPGTPLRTMVPESSTTVCQGCAAKGISKRFFIGIGKYHCNNCGQVMCGSCTTNRFMLPGKNERPKRVCSACYERLYFAQPTRSIHGTVAGKEDTDLVFVLAEIPACLWQFRELTQLRMPDNEMETLPPAVANLRQLRVLDVANNRLPQLPEELGCLQQLEELYVAGNRLVSLPRTLASLTRLRKLDLSRNRLIALPDSLGRLSALEHLAVDDNPALADLPSVQASASPASPSPAALSSPAPASAPSSPATAATASSPPASYLGLHTFWLARTGLQHFPPLLLHIRTLTELSLEGSLIGTIPDAIDALSGLVHLNLADTGLTQLTLSLMRLAFLEELVLDRNPGLQLRPELGRLSSLQTLSLNSCGLSTVPDTLGKLSHLRVLNLADNSLEHLPATLARLTSLASIDLINNPGLSSPPYEVVQQGARAVVNFLKQLRDAGASSYSRLKLIIVGEGKAGKTSLIRSMTRDTPSLTEEQERTRGVEVCVFEPDTLPSGVAVGTPSPAAEAGEETASGPDEEAPPAPVLPIFDIWDLGGQQVYHATHQLFMTRTRALYVLVCDLSLPREDTKPGFWLRSLIARAPGSALLVVGTKIDLCETPEAATARGNEVLSELLAEHRTWNEACQRQLAAFKEIVAAEPGNRAAQAERARLQYLVDHPLQMPDKMLFASPATMAGVDSFRDAVVRTALTLFPSLARPIPSSWYRLMQEVESLRESGSMLAYEGEYKALQDKCGFGSDEAGAQGFREATEFLHNLGRILHFREVPILCQTVFLRPAWLVNVLRVVIRPDFDRFLRRTVEHGDDALALSEANRRERRFIAQLQEHGQLQYSLLPLLISTRAGALQAEMEKPMPVDRRTQLEIELRDIGALKPEVVIGLLGELQLAFPAAGKEEACVIAPLMPRTVPAEALGAWPTGAIGGSGLSSAWVTELDFLPAGLIERVLALCSSRYTRMHAWRCGAVFELESPLHAKATVLLHASPRTRQGRARVVLVGRTADGSMPGGLNALAAGLLLAQRSIQHVMQTLFPGLIAMEFAGCHTCLGSVPFTVDDTERLFSPDSALTIASFFKVVNLEEREWANCESCGARCIAAALKLAVLTERGRPAPPLVGEIEELLGVLGPVSTSCIGDLLFSSAEAEEGGGSTGGRGASSEGGSTNTGASGGASNNNDEEDDDDEVEWDLVC